MKYWAYIGSETLGPFEKEKLFELPNFDSSSLICPQTPAGEKTEDWKEASAYPEVSAMLNFPLSGALKPQSVDNQPKQPSVAPPPALGPEGPAGIGQTGGVDTASEPAALTPEQLQGKPQYGSISGLPAQEEGRMTPPPASEPEWPSEAGQATGWMTAPERKFKPLTASSLQPTAPPPSSLGNVKTEANHFGTSEPPEETPAAVDQKGHEIPSKTQTFGENTLTRQELNSQLEPLRQKLEQMGDMLASIGNSQFQRDLLGRLSSFESAISDIKTSLSTGTRQTGVSLAPIENFTPAPEKTVTTIVEKSNFLGKLFRLTMTLLLIVAIALVAVFVLKQQGIFDATKFISFPIPFLTDHKAAAKMAVQDAQTAQFPTGQDQAPRGAESAGLPADTGQNGDTAQKQEPQAKAETVPPEVIYFIRSYALRPGGLTLENAIRQEAAKAGWDSDKLDWEGKSAGTEGFYHLSAVVPSKDGKSRLAFTYEASAKQKTVKPLDDAGKACMEALVAASTLKKQPKAKATKNRRQAKSVRTQAPTPAQPRQAAQKRAAPEDEYEYVDEEEDTGK